MKAVQLSTGRSVALKVLDVDASDPGARRRFDRERESRELPESAELREAYEAMRRFSAITSGETDDSPA